MYSPRGCPFKGHSISFSVCHTVGFSRRSATLRCLGSPKLRFQEQAVKSLLFLMFVCSLSSCKAEGQLLGQQASLLPFPCPARSDWYRIRKPKPNWKLSSFYFRHSRHRAGSLECTPGPKSQPLVALGLSRNPLPLLTRPQVGPTSYYLRVRPSIEKDIQPPRINLYQHHGHHK